MKSQLTFMKRQLAGVILVFHQIMLIIHNLNISFPLLYVLPRFDRTDTSKESYETSLRANTLITAGQNPGGSSFTLNLRNLSFKFYEEAISSDLLLYGNCKN